MPLKALVRRDVDQARREAYPTIGDQLGALWKILEDGPTPDDAKEIQQQIRDVKAKFPKRREA